MINSQRKIRILATVFAVLVTTSYPSFCWASKSDLDSSATVTVGVPDSSSFAESVKKAGDFYGSYDRAREKIKAGEYDAAIKLLHECLQAVVLKPENAMVYRYLVGIYGDLGDLDNELKSIELFVKYTMNETQKEIYNKKAADIRAALAKSRAPITMADRYPIKPIYGGPRFNSFREVLVAKEQSRALIEKADKALREEHIEDAIGYYRQAYTPEGWDNESIKVGLLKAFALSGHYGNALEVLNDTKSQFKVLGSEEALNGKVRERLMQAVKDGKLVFSDDPTKHPEEFYLGAKPKHKSR